uniref:Uncharacterized protein n=1 Tax=Panagrolaimus davidi TaxID=227884 RepID=A0A914Q8G2_9BILA
MAEEDAITFEPPSPQDNYFMQPSNDGGLFHQTSFEQPVFTPQDQFSSPFSVPQYQFDQEPMDHQFSPFPLPSSQRQYIPVEISPSQQQPPSVLQNRFQGPLSTFTDQQPYSVQRDESINPGEEFLMFGNMPSASTTFYEKTWSERGLKTPDNVVINGDNPELREVLKNQAPASNIVAAAQRKRRKRKNPSDQTITSDSNIENNKDNTSNIAAEITPANIFGNNNAPTTMPSSEMPPIRSETISSQSKEASEKPKGFTPAELARLARVTQDISQKLQTEMQNEPYWGNGSYNPHPSTYAVNLLMQPRYAPPTNIRPVRYPPLQPPPSSSHIRPPPSSRNDHSNISSHPQISDKSDTGVENSILSQLLEEEHSPLKQPPLSHYEIHKEHYAQKLGIPVNKDNGNDGGANQPISSSGNSRRGSKTDTSEILRLDLNKPGPCNKDIISSVSSPPNLNLPGTSAPTNYIDSAPGPSGSKQTSGGTVARNKKPSQNPNITMEEIIAQLSENDPNYKLVPRNDNQQSAGLSSGVPLQQNATTRFLPQIPSYSNRPIAEHYIIPPAPPGPQRVLRFFRPERPPPRPRPPPPSYEVPLTYPTHTHIPAHYSPNSVVKNGDIKHMENAEFDRLPPSYIQQPAQIPHLMPRDPVPRFSNNSSMYSEEQNAQLRE